MTDMVSQSPTFSRNMLDKVGQSPTFSKNMLGKVGQSPNFSGNMSGKVVQSLFPGTCPEKVGDWPTFSRNMSSKVGQLPPLSRNMSSIVTASRQGSYRSWKAKFQTLPRLFSLIFQTQNYIGNRFTQTFYKVTMFPFPLVGCVLILKTTWQLIHWNFEHIKFLYNYLSRKQREVFMPEVKENPDFYQIFPSFLRL